MTSPEAGTRGTAETTTVHGAADGRGGPRPVRPGVRAAAAVAVAGLALAACGGSGLKVVSPTTAAPAPTTPSAPTTPAVPTSPATTTTSTTVATSGEASKTPEQILADAKAATDAATSLTVSGATVTNGQRVSLDLALGHGSGGGTVSQGGNAFQIIVRPPSLYLKASAATWTRLSNPTAAALLAGKWIQTSASDPSFGSLASLLDASKITAQITPAGTVTKGAVTTFRGQPAIPLRDRGAGNGGTLYVAATGRPYILGLTAVGRDSGVLTFSQYGTAVIPAAPTGAVSLKKLEQGG